MPEQKWHEYLWQQRFAKLLSTCQIYRFAKSFSISNILAFICWIYVSAWFDDWTFVLKPLKSV